MKTPKFEVYKAKDGYRWRLKARNGKIVASGEGYKTKRAAMRVDDILRDCYNGDWRTCTEMVEI